MTAAADGTARTRLTWIEDRPVPLDHGGPTDRPYVPMATDADTLLGIRPFERVVARLPDKVAAYDGTMRLTYAEMLDRVYGLAARIDAAVPPGGVVASLVGSTVAAPIIVMACVAVGRTLVPLDAGHPLERKAAIMQESGAVALIVEAGAAHDDGFVAADLPRLTLDPAAVTGAARIEAPGDPDAPMYVIFTSGSTGRPKGIAYANAASATMAQQVDLFHINEDDVLIGLGSLSTGGSRDAFLALTTGATIRLVDVKTAGLMEALRVMGEEGVTFLSFVPSFVRMVFGLPGVERSVRHLRVLDLHGERTLAPDLALMREKLPADCRISITMGASETGFVFSWFVDEAKIEGGVAPVGYLLPGKRVALVDEAGGPTPPGAIGELLVGGTLAAGGWQAGRLTTGRYLSDPDHPGERLYPMGDLLRMRDDGLFDYIGRADRRLKIHGLWADLGEIEAALRSCGGIADAVALPIEVDGEGDAIVAVVVADDGDEAPDAATLRRAVGLATAEHMIPRTIRVIDTIPRLANYKPDLVRLRTLFTT
ncbi:MAG: AMP-binding protein [Sphingomonas adhaesiva]|uniref:AMP-binding protein n=1 Tax=Sphingomonas adhaesiva TaxID=28212 RepID=UPI002FFD31EB